MLDDQSYLPSQHWAWDFSGLQRIVPEELFRILSHTEWVLMTREQMLDRAMASDGEFDRVFITGVLSTGIYCLPSCKARKPKPENIRFFDTVEQAREAGLRACKKCKPDDFLEGVDQDLDRLEGVVKTLKERPQSFASISDLGEAAGFGSTKLFESVRRHYHTTPGELIVRARVDASCQRLLETDAAVADIAFEVGFETLSTFYEHFNRLIGMAPMTYRRLPCAREFSIALPENFLPQTVLRYYGRDPDSVCEQVNGHELTITGGSDASPGFVRLQFGEDTVHCEVEGLPTLEAHKGVVRILGLRQDPKPFEQLAAKLGLERLVAGRRGLRVPLTFSPYDAVVWSILGQQVNLPFAYKLRRRLCELVGSKLANGMVSPASPSRVAALEPDDLLPLQFSRRKAEYLIDISRKICKNEINLDDLEFGSATKAEKTLLEVRGLGPWSVNYLMMRGLGFADCLPIGDTGLTTALFRHFELDQRPDPKTTAALMEPFSPYRSIACLHLWQSLKFES